MRHPITDAQRCRHGLISTICYEHSLTPSRLTWIQASAECERRRKSLVTVAEMAELKYIHQWLLQLQLTEEDRAIYLGGNAENQWLLSRLLISLLFREGRNKMLHLGQIKW